MWSSGNGSCQDLDLWNKSGGSGSGSGSDSLQNAINQLEDLHDSGVIDHEEEKRRVTFLSVSFDERGDDDDIRYDYDSETDSSALLPIIEIWMACCGFFKRLYRQVIPGSWRNRGESHFSRFDDDL
jgi:hypothetical protein